MKQSSKLAYLRQLCNLQVPESALVPQVLTELSELLHLDMCCFNWVDGSGDISHAHTAGITPPMSVITRYISEYVNAEEVELGLTTRDMRQHPSRFLGSSSFGSGFCETILFNEILRPIGLKYITNIGVFQGGRMLGTLSCNRSGDQREFSAADTQTLGFILPYLATAAKPRGDIEVQWSQQEEHGLILIDTQGRIKHADALGISRLTRATQSSHSSSSRHRSNDHLLTPLKALAQEVLKLEAGQVISPPELTFLNQGSRYVLRARAMRASPGESLSLIAVSIMQWTPHALKLLQWLSARGLSLRHRELALALIEGNTVSQAAKRLAVTQGTAQDYLDAIYLKLEVRSRQALLEKMHSLH